MKRDENLGETQLSSTSLDSLAGGRVADQVAGRAKLSTVQAAFQSAFSIRDESPPSRHATKSRASRDAYEA
jgi:hypothetical protein